MFGFRSRYDFSSRYLRGAFRGWGYQDFAAGSITTTSVTISDNENGDDVDFVSTNIVNTTAVIVRSDAPAKKVYTGSSALWSTKVEVSAHTGTSITLSGVPHSSWSVRIYYFYDYEWGMPTNYAIPSKAVAANLFAELQDLLITEEEIGDGSKDAVFNTIENTPIGGTTASTGDFTSLSASGTLTLTDADHDFVFQEMASASTQLELMKNESAAGAIFGLRTKDADTTYGCQLWIYAQEEWDAGNSRWDREYLKIGYTTDGRYVFSADKLNAGGTYPFYFITDGVTQLVISSDVYTPLNFRAGSLEFDATSNYIGVTGDSDLLTLASDFLQVSGDLTVLGNVNLTGNIQLTTSDIGVTGDTDLLQLATNQLTVDGDLDVTGTVFNAAELVEFDSNIRLNDPYHLEFGGADAYIYSNDGQDLDLVIGGTAGVNIGNLRIVSNNTVGYGEITDSRGRISFGNEDLVTSGTINATSIQILNNILDTNEWAYLDGLDQALKTTDAPGFATGVTIGNLTLANGSINDSGGTISFNCDLLPSADNTYELGTETGGDKKWKAGWFNLFVEVGTLTIAGGSITDSSTAISFDNENLSTSGTFSSGAITATSVTRIGDATNKMMVAADGEISLAGTARVTKIAPLVYLSGTAGGGTENNLRGDDFDKDADEYVIYTGYAPNDLESGTTSYLKFRWCPTATNSDGTDRYVYWRGVWTAAGTSGTIPSTNTVTAYSTTVPDEEVAQTIHVNSFPTAGVSVSPGDFITVILYRDADNGSDDYGADAFVFKDMYLEFTSNKLGTPT